MDALALFKIENLTYFYPETEKPALQEINLTVEEGEFLLVTGGSGSGKSSLGRALAGLLPDFYGGKIGGRIFLSGRDIRDTDRRSLAGQVGMVFQDPEKQLVMTGVEAEIAFGLENLGLTQPEMFRRVGEVVSFLGFGPLKQELTANLSGGQKQKLALASVLAMQPGALILDEPTSQLDPVAAEEFFNLVKRLNEELNVTIVLIEQRLERCFHLADRVAVLEDGRIVRSGAAGEVAVWQVKNGFPFVPPVAGLFAHLDFPVVPLTVKEGRRLLQEHFHIRGDAPGAGVGRFRPVRTRREEAAGNPGDKKTGPVAEVKNVWFTYPNGREVLHGVSLKVRAGEFTAVLGENAAGKTTLLKHLAGLLKPGRGKVLVHGKDTGRTSPQEMARTVGYLSQNPNDYLFQDTVAQELNFSLVNLGLSDDGRTDRLLKKLKLARYRQTNPRDLSSGERQRVALASVLAAGPRLLLLDEPTRGLDYRLKSELGGLLRDCAAEGIAVVLVTHDVEFAAEYAERVVILFDGRVACDGTGQAVLAESMFYAPQVGRLFRGTGYGVLTFREAVAKLQERS